MTECHDRPSPVDAAAPPDACSILLTTPPKRQIWKYQGFECKMEASKLPCARCQILGSSFRSRPGKPNQREGQNEKFMNFALFCEFWCFSFGKQARFTLNFCSGMPLPKVHELTFLWFGLPGPLLIHGEVNRNRGFPNTDCAKIGVL